eukprot:TRINITY_DN67960_c7_g7_i1.p1 TRINITY_DN67960_c7_g7~~TRINITY_DN67960_c7_g7_i1.p1  ORF type:complete len:301 (+),score=15.68 TRINITY_DN67960_c7_g7_i1:236-1138(+)
MEQAVPTLTHMALVELIRKGLVSLVVSQNVDGLHIRSGIPSKNMAELHGNCYLEYCKTCKTEYTRPFDVTEHHGNQAPTKTFHDTGRKCTKPGCGGGLQNTIINFGERLPEKALTLAWNTSDAADLAIVLGTSLTVTPAADHPQAAKDNGAKLVIVNLQATPLDKKADLRLHTETDKVMQQVMANLGLEIPPFDNDKFFAELQGQNYGMELTVGHEVTDKDWRVYVTTAYGNGDDLCNLVEFECEGRTKQVSDPPFQITGKVTEKMPKVQVKITVFDFTLEPISLEVDLNTPPCTIPLVR